MFRPLKLFNKNTVKVVAVNTSRTKIIFSEAYLDKAQRMKLWNLENKLIFGSLIETSKIKCSKSIKDRPKRVGRNKIHKQQQTEALVPFSLFTSPKDLKKESVKNSKSQITDSKLNDLISSQNFITKDLHLQIDNVSTNIIIKNSTKGQNKNSLLCSGLPLEIDITNGTNGILAKSKNNIPSIIIRNLKLFPMLAYNQNSLANSDCPPVDKILRITASDDSKKLPSVTKILDQTLSPESRALLDKWKEGKIAELGEEGFQKYMKGQLDTGSRYHDTLSKYLVIPPPDLLTIDPNLKGLLTSVAYVLKTIKSPRAIESHVIHPVLKYQGVIDCIAYYNDKPTLIEWKTSNKPKPTLAMTYDNPVQLAAYFGAISHDPNYKALNVRDALLVIAYTDGSPADVHHLTTDQLRQHWATWLTRLEKYWEANESVRSELKAQKIKEDEMKADKNGGENDSSKG